jgi:hypothetical protein
MVKVRACLIPCLAFVCEPASLQSTSLSVPQFHGDHPTVRRVVDNPSCVGRASAAMVLDLGRSRAARPTNRSPVPARQRPDRAASRSPGLSGQAPRLARRSLGRRSSNKAHFSTTLRFRRFSRRCLACLSSTSNAPSAMARYLVQRSNRIIQVSRYPQHKPSGRRTP